MKAALVALVAMTAVAVADPDPHRKVVVLEYRAGSTALQGIATRMVAALGTQTSLAVLGPDQTRAVYGEHLDQVIVKCAGEAECVARIGQKVGAAEVILIGVSELGDVILTMQRIVVADRRVASRVADSLASGALPSDAQLSQYLARVLPPTDFLRFGVIQIDATEPGADVTINKESRGVTPIPPLKLPAPASYDIHVEKRGFLPFDTSIALPADGEIKLPVRLQHPGGKTAWYQHWYVLAAAGVIVIGATGGAFLIANDKTPSSVPVTGTVGH
jgi:hypothetical protein